MDRQSQGAVLGISGLVLGVVQYWQAMTRTSTTMGMVVDAGPFLLLALTIVFTGYWIGWRSPEVGDTEGIIVGWAIGGAVSFGAVSTLILTSMNVTLDVFSVSAVAAATVVDTVTVGTLAGTLIGLYDEQSRMRLSELQRQRDRVEAFANRAADLNNYGQALNKCASTEEVSALCIEAVATLVDINETAFVEHADGVARIIDSTITGLSDETIAKLAMESLESEPGSVVSHTEELPPELDDAVDSVLTMRVTEPGTNRYTIVALDRDGTELTEETQSLLEMLLSHVGTALSTIASPEPFDDHQAIELDD